MPSIPNPWLDLPQSAPFIAPCDRAALDGLRPALRERLQLQLLPAPYAGPRDATVVLLLAHPSYNPEDDAQQSPAAEAPLAREFAAQQREALRFASRLPICFLDPQFAQTGAGEYYHRRFKQLIEDCGVQAVSEHMLLLHRFPYRYAGGSFNLALSSLQFTLALLREALERGAQVVIGSGAGAWIEALPQLAAYDYIQLHSSRSPYLSPKNLGVAGYARVLAALRK